MGGLALSIAVNDMELQGALNALASFGSTDALAPAWEVIGEQMVNKTLMRFHGGYGPDGTPWVPSLRAKKTGGQTLVLKGYLRASIGKNLLPNGVEWGTNFAYARIHQLGGTIDIAARGQYIYRRFDKRTGELGNRFVHKRRSNFAQPVEIKAYRITIPARPYLGVDDEDRRYAVETLKGRVLGIIIENSKRFNGGGAP